MGRQVLTVGVRADIAAGLQAGRGVGVTRTTRGTVIAGLPAGNQAGARAGILIDAVTGMPATVRGLPTWD